MTVKVRVLAAPFFLLGLIPLLTQTPTTVRDGFTVLKDKTGWVLLGFVSVATDELVLDFATEPSFETLGRNTHPSEGALPKIGDRIRARYGWAIVILDYKLTGEKNGLISPATRQTLYPADNTDLEIPKGTVVEVRDIQISKPYGEEKAVWARVAPPRKQP
jgi:hypothetical protein